MHQNLPYQHLLGIDWGTSNRRAYLIGRGGDSLAKHSDGQGLLAVQGAFPASLAVLRASMGVESAVPVVMSGMVGSSGGWQEAPYLDIGVALDQLPQHLVPLGGYRNHFIVPGYSTRDPHIDVMRGEETQLLGLVAQGIRDGWTVLPGTHSKWVLLRDGRITQLSTYMTGELFAMLGESGTLAGVMANGRDDTEAFVDGLSKARLGKPLTNSLFGVRARVVTQSLAADKARAFVSGLLIGAEFVAARRRARAGIEQTVHLIASPVLGALYGRAAECFGMRAVVHDPDAVYLSALQQFFTVLDR